MANSGSYQIKISNTSSTPNEYLQVAWVVNSQSVANNTSNVTFKLNIYSTYGSGAQPYSLDNSSEKTASLKVNGTQRYYEHNDQWDSPALAIDFRNTSASSPRTLGSWTGTINHNNDGTSPAISLEGYLYYGDTATSHSGLPGGHTVTYTIPAGTFSTIARASKPTCPSTSSFGSAIKITTNRAASSFTHTLVFSCNGHSQTVTGVGAEYNFTIPASWAPTTNANSQTLTITCTTYSGSTNVGTGTCTSTVSVPASWVPSVTISYSKTNAADNGDILANVTTVNFTATGTAVQYASVSSYSWSGAVSGSGATKSLIPTSAGTITVTVTVTDSRGRTGTATLNLSTTNAAGTIITDKTSMIFGETISSTITKKKASFTNIISYKIGSSKIVADSDIGTGTTDTKTIPTSSASYLPNATSGTMVIELNTYDGLVLVGTTTKNIAIAIPSSWAPSIGSVTLTNVDAFNNQLLKTKSRITATANSVEPSLGATIASVSFTSQDLSATVSSSPYTATSGAFTNYGTFTVTAVVTDSRGLTATIESVSYTVIDYAPPTLSMSGHRCTSFGEPNDFAEYVQLYLSGSWADEVNGNTWSAYVYKKQVGSDLGPSLAWSVTNQNGSLSVDSSIIPASVDYSFEFTAYVEDAVGGVSETLLLQISTGSVILDLWKDKLVAFRKTANQGLYADLGGTGTEKIFYSEGIQFFNGALYVPATGDDGFLNGWVRVRSGGSGGQSAYDYAVSQGYRGTEAEFAALMADYATVGQEAEQAAQDAQAAAESVSQSAAQIAANTNAIRDIQESLTDLDETIAADVEEWLDAHPEATSTVLDNSVSIQKLSPEVKSQLIDISYYGDIAVEKDRTNNTDCYIATIPVLDSDGNTIKPYVASDADRSPLEYAQKNGTTLTTNTNISMRKVSGGTNARGNIIGAGEVLYSQDVTDALIPNKVGYLTISEDRQTVKTYPINTTLAVLQADPDVYNCMTYYYPLVENGVAVDNSSTTGNETGVVSNPNPRLAIGVKADKSLVIFACDGRTGINAGLTSDELAAAMIAKGCVNAWNLDGGGSTSFNVMGSKLNRNIDDDGTADRAIHWTFNVKKPTNQKTVGDIFAKVGLEKQQTIQQIIPLVNYIDSKYSAAISTINAKEDFISNADLNAIDYTCLTYVTRTTNGPSDVNVNGYVINIVRSNDAGYKTQFYVPYDEDALYYRRCNGGSWSSWREVLQNLTATETTLYSSRFTSASSPVTLTGAMKYSSLTFMGRPGSSIDINASITIPTANIGSSTINYMISDPLAYFAFSLTASGDDVIMTYVSETTAGSGRIARVYAMG